ncbi:uncharacterized protein BDV17DRAFT_291669 [Aspergillus undulatus]|uniref:uncharacterized protein n=1 Tax=Aspergillus undulatus TaxID=1810928 RepID=UPI003CCD7E6A
MAAPAAKSRTGLYAALGFLGAGGYYFYRAGGDPKVAGDEIRHDVAVARSKAPGTESGERAGEKAGLETNLNIDEAANNPQTKNSDLASQAQRKFDEFSASGKDQANKLRADAEAQANKLKDEASRLGNEAEEKANEAKNTVSGWFGGKK